MRGAGFLSALLGRGYASVQASASEPGGYFIPNTDLRCIFYQPPISGEDQGIAAIQDGDRGKRFQAGCTAFQNSAALKQLPTGGSRQVCNLSLKLLAHSSQTASCIVVTDCGGDSLTASLKNLQDLTLRLFQTE